MLYSRTRSMLSVSSDVKKLSRSLDQKFKRQIPFITSVALNSTAFDARQAVQKSLPQILDRPSTYTVKSVQVLKSSKRKLVSAVGFASRTFGKLPRNAGIAPAEYIKRLIAGGVRQKKTTRGIPVPVNARLNKFGNLSRNYLKNKVEASRSFIATIKGTEGLWETRGRGKNKSLRLLVSFKDRTTYPKGIFPFKSIVKKSIKKTFQKNFKTAYSKATKRK